jgi:hypothetical protein
VKGKKGTWRKHEGGRNKDLMKYLRNDGGK